MVNFILDLMGAVGGILAVGAAYVAVGGGFTRPLR